MAKEKLTPRILEAMKKVVEYSWKDELEDYQEQAEESDLRTAAENHVFTELVVLNNAVNGTDKRPWEYIGYPRELKDYVPTATRRG